MTIWELLGYLMVSIGSGVVTGAACVVIGGVGGLSVVIRRINLLEQKLDDTDSRITREVKTRASHAAVDAKAEQRTAKQIAEEHLANKPAESGGRPTVVNLNRR